MDETARPNPGRDVAGSIPVGAESSSDDEDEEEEEEEVEEGGGGRGKGGDQR